MGNTDEKRTSTRADRRRMIISAFREHLASDSTRGDTARLRDLVAEGPRTIVANGDIDGLVSAQMLASVTGWKVGAVVWGDKASVHQDLRDQIPEGEGFMKASGLLFLVDLFSPHIPGVSNHPVLWGEKRRASSAEVYELTQDFDESIREAAQDRLLASPSLWAGIAGAQSESSKKNAFEYKYPLGTAQILLALLEAAGRQPKLFDRQYLPWLIANCDGGLRSVSEYHYNVPMWWSAMAAAVGPASYSEQIYKIATECKPTEFVSLDRSFRHEYGNEGVSRHLNEQWNLRPEGDPTAVAAVTHWLEDLTGWSDPFLGGVDLLDSDLWWKADLDRGSVPTSGKLGTTKAEVIDEVKEIRDGLEHALNSISMGFAKFRERPLQLEWTSTWWKPQV